MSRGPGQQTITELIASDSHGTWTVGQICERIYPDEWRVQKKHRVVVLRPDAGVKVAGLSVECVLAAL
jgi:hypothetical protein